MTENELSYLIRGAVFKVYNSIGPGMFERVYEKALVHELTALNLDVKCQVTLPAFYEEVRMDGGYRIDLLIDNKVIVEVKSVEHLTEVHHKQLITYLKMSRLKLGLLVNFNTKNISSSIFRKVNNL